MRYGAGLMETARFLIESGIDIAANAGGVTPGQYAYHLALESRDSSCIGDIWDRALAACGIDVAESRVGHPRVGRYDYQYTLQRFMEMWNGHESLCPYYEEAVADSATYSNRAIYWSQVCTSDACPYHDKIAEGYLCDPDVTLSDSSEDSSEQGGVVIEDDELE
jgi:hypothetical protein